MIKPFIFRKALFAPAMLLLGSIFLHSCTEEMPILKPLGTYSNYVPATVSSKSMINLKINNTQSDITNTKPGTIVFNVVTGGTTLPNFRTYLIAGDNGSTTNRALYSVTFHSDSVGNNIYVFDGSQVIVNKKTYTSFNISGSNKFSVTKLDEKTNTAVGSFSYYVYDDALHPTDSLYVTGAFNIFK